MCLRKEKERNGLIIQVAFYGLKTHVLQMDAGQLRYEIPKTEEEYSKAQLVPLGKYLQRKGMIL